MWEISIHHVCGFILAIVFTPVVLGIFTYLNNTNSIIFYLVEIIGLGFFIAITPIDVIIIYILTTIVSIVISNYAGERFSWYNIVS